MPGWPRRLSVLLLGIAAIMVHHMFFRSLPVASRRHWVPDSALGDTARVVAARVSDQHDAASLGPGAVAAPGPVAPATPPPSSVPPPDAASGVPTVVSERRSRSRLAVVGLAAGVAPPNLYKFVRSLRESSDADVVVFVDALSPEVTEMFWRFRVTSRVFSLDALPEHARRYHPSSYRWPLIRDFLTALPPQEQYDWLMFTDVRDTVFQHDPFSHVVAGPEGFYAFQGTL